jgi:hypothetical protein
MDTYTIYKATSPNGKVYVGLTCHTLGVRRKQHEYDALRFPVGTRLFCNALRKYGSRMKWEVLETGEGKEWAATREQHFIALYGSNDGRYGYNLTKGGEGSPVDNTRKRMAQAHPVLRSDGRPFSSARHAAIAMRAANDDAVSKAMRRGGSCAGFTFRAISQDEYEAALVAWDKKVSEGHTEQEPMWTFSRAGHRHSPTARANMARAKKGKAHAPEHQKNLCAAISKPVLRSDGRTFASIVEVAQDMGLTPAQVTYSVKTGYPRGGHTLTWG